MVYMNKNKKRLSRLLISILALSGVNINAMKNVKQTYRNSRSAKKSKKIINQNIRNLKNNLELEYNELSPNDVKIRQFGRPTSFNIEVKDMMN